MKYRILIAGLALMMFGGLCVMENGMVAAKPHEPDGRSTSSIYALAGEFRTVFANLLWIKADQYHHEFIERNPHWTQNTELIGMMDMITALDPHFVEAYSVGGALYSLGKKEHKRALEFLQEGVRNNPKAWTLHKDIAIISARHFNDFHQAQIHARLALKYCDDGFYTSSLKTLVRTTDRLAKEHAQRVSSKL